MDYGKESLADRLAAAYVAGTLRAGARRRFEALLSGHPMLRAAVVQWQRRLMPLTAVIEPVTPPASVWKRIEAHVGVAPAMAAPRHFWQQLSFWRGLTGLATVAALSLGLLLAVPGPVQPPIVIVLEATGNSANGAIVPASFVAGISGDGRAVVTRPLTHVNLEASRSLELWALPVQGAPRSLGVISTQGATVARRADQMKGAAGLAVTLEPAGGSPTGQPTGPILFVGKLQT